MDSDTVGVDQADGGHVDGSALAAVLVEVCGRRCAIPVEHVAEVHAAVLPSLLPGAPEVVAGMVNRRGQVIAVLDLRRRFDLPGRPVQLSDRLVVVETAVRTVAVLVDAVVDLVTLVAEPLDAVATGVEDDSSISGVAVLPDGLALITDVDAFLSGHERVRLEEALARTAGRASQ